MLKIVYDFSGIKFANYSPFSYVFVLKKQGQPFIKLSLYCKFGL